MLRISTLGGLTIERDGKPIDGFHSQKVEALMVYLACSQHEHPREVLAEMFWEDSDLKQSMGTRGEFTVTDSAATGRSMLCYCPLP